MSTKPFQFEAALAELEEITRWFESSEVDLDAGLAKFERGMELAAALKEHLQTVENRVERVKARFAASGAPAADLEPSDDTASETPELFN